MSISRCLEHVLGILTLQYGLMPLCVDMTAVAMTSTMRKTIEMTMQSNMTPKRGLVLTSRRTVYS